MRSLALLLVFGAACAHLPPPPPPPPTVAREAVNLLSQVETEGASAAAYVVDATTGEVLFAHHEGTRLLPASTMKLATTAAALAALGPEFRFHTAVALSGMQAGALFSGDVVLHASGDPSLGAERFAETAPAATCDRIAQALSARGIKQWKGSVRIAGNEAVAALGPGWAWDDLAYDYSAAPAAFVWNENSVTLQVSRAAGEKCEAPTVRIEPAITLAADVREEAQPQGSSFACVRDRLDSKVHCTWRHPAAECPRTASAHIAIDDPAEELRACVEDALGRASIARVTVGASESGPRPAQPPEEAPLLVLESPPLAELVRATNKESLNLYAERLALTLTKNATGGEEYAALHDVLAADQQARGIAARDLVQVDGSGLSRYNHATARALVQLLATSVAQPYGGALVESLPVVGVDGTLARHKLSEAARGKVRAKSGTLTGQRAFAGVVDRPQDPAHPRVVFALMLGNMVQPSLSSNEVFDRFAEMLVALPLR